MKIPTLSSLIKKQKFDWVNPNISDTLFPTPKEIGTDFKLYDTKIRISSEDVVKLMKKDGYKPATAWELLSWKEWNENDWVVVLGSVGEVYGDRRVPCLDGDASGRGLDLYWWDGDWHARYRFLGVRNLVPSDSKLVDELRDSDPLTLAIKTVKDAGYVIYKQL